MPDTTLVILTHKFPSAGGEPYLWDELSVTASQFKKILICPQNVNGVIEKPVGWSDHISITATDVNQVKIGTYKILKEIMPVLAGEFSVIPSKKLFFSLLKFNISFLKQAYLRAMFLKRQTDNEKNCIMYAYWTDDLAVTGAFLKQMRPDIKFISRAHGFDVFEEQSDYRYIFFRKFQLGALDALYTVSQAGANHLKNKWKMFSAKISMMRLGVKSDGKICFEQGDIIRLVTCSHIRSIKRLDRMAEILHHISTRQVEWHVIGDGQDAQKIRTMVKTLPANIKVIFHGHMQAAAIHNLYGSKHFDFFVSLSSSEGLPVSMMEAISHGIPVLSTDVGGCNEIVNAGTGHLISAVFENKEVSDIILNCKSGVFDSAAARAAIKQFWADYFDAEKNYLLFSKALQKL